MKSKTKSYLLSRRKLFLSEEFEQKDDSSNKKKKNVTTKKFAKTLGANKNATTDVHNL